MAVTREQWAAREHALAQSRRATHPIHEGLLQQAAVASALLTGHPAWDVYLQRVQVLLDLAQADLAQWHDKIAGAYEDADLRVIQTQVNIAATKIAVLQTCMSLPQEILAHAADALDKPVE